MDESLLRHVHGLYSSTTRHNPVPDRPAAVLFKDPKPMVESGTAQWGLEITAADFEQLKLGFTPEEMEDKWIIAATGPDENGVTSVHILRSWTHSEIYVLHVKPTGDAGGARIESFTWEKALGEDGKIRVSERQAKKEAVLLCRIHAHCKFEKLPEYDASIFWNRESEGDEEEDK